MMFQAVQPVPSAAQLRWQREEVNAFFHFGMNTYTGKEWGDGTESPSLFNPTRLDCRQWAKVAKAAGFRVGILTAKHHDGFCLWPSRYTEHSVKNSPWMNGKGDVVREFVEAFRAEGLQVGVYLSPWDRHEKCYGDSPRYNDHYCGQLTELLTQYGSMQEVWFDGACAEGANGRRQEYDWTRYFDLVKTLQPQAVTFGDGGTDVRWVGNERGIAGETCWSSISISRIRFPGDSGICEANDAEAQVDLYKMLTEGTRPGLVADCAWRPAECDVSIRPGWFYHDSENASVRSVEDLLDLYFKSVGRNGLLLLNLPPDRDGLVDEIDASRVTEFRSELNRIFANNFAVGGIISASSTWPGHGVEALFGAELNDFWAPEESDSVPSLEITFPQSVEVRVVCMQEAIELGQRVASYRIEVLDLAGEWKSVLKGTTIGHKKLDRISEIKTNGIRVVFEESVATPAIRSLSVY